MIDLGSAPPSNAYLSLDDLRRSERWYPLKVLVCSECWLVQTEDIVDSADLFTAEYAYFSSYSETWNEHAHRYVDMVIDRFSVGRDDLVIEVAANDGYLLRFVEARGIPCVGIEPTGATAAAARTLGLEIIDDFFGVELARRLVDEGRRPRVMVANNVLAHVPDINDFVQAFAILLADDGVATFEFPHLLRLIEDGLFDTIYHEHFSYLSLTAVERIFRVNGLRVFDVEELPTHGGSLRVFAQRADTGHALCTERVADLLAMETAGGVLTHDLYATLQAKAERAASEFVSFLLEARRSGRTVVGYGAAAKGNTLLNFAGLRPHLLPLVADRNPAKQGMWLPGSRIPIVADDEFRVLRPDYVVILPWNLRSEIEAQLGEVRSWGGRFVVALPELQVW